MSVAHVRRNPWKAIKQTFYRIHLLTATKRWGFEVSRSRKRPRKKHEKATKNALLATKKHEKHEHWHGHRYIFAFFVLVVFSRPNGFSRLNGFSRPNGLSRPNWFHGQIGFHGHGVSGKVIWSKDLWTSKLRSNRPLGPVLVAIY